MDELAEWQARVEAQLAEHAAQFRALFEVMAAACEAAGIELPGGSEPLAQAVEKARREGRSQPVRLTFGDKEWVAIAGPEASADAATMETLRRLAEGDPP